MFFIAFRDRGKEGMRETSVGCPCAGPGWGLNPQSRYVTLLGIEPATFWLHTNRMTLQHVQGKNGFYIFKRL